jgi:hypothetical protein
LEQHAGGAQAQTVLGQSGAFLCAQRPVATAAQNGSR